MGAKIVGIMLAIVIVVCIYYGYEHYKQQKTSESGAMHCTGCMSPEDEAKFKLENSGDAPVAAGEHSESRAQMASNEAATPTQEPINTTSSGMSSQPSVPPGGIMQNNGQPTQNTTQPQNGYVMTNTSANGPAPTMDTQSANAPNGMRFSGSGSYQWYRQGDLTWRVDTSSGRSCIVYATMEEWRKQIVMSHGCGGNA